MTKIIDSKHHAVLDYMTAGTFLAAAAYYRNRHNTASSFALLNGVSIVMLSLFTDYPGGLFRTISFRTHGFIDSALAAMTAAGPALLGFGNDREAFTFYAQAAAETGVISATDFSDVAYGDL